ncbi:MAG: DNA methyltransferase [Chloroflexota bacterium]|nr:DNA methyltransferase [Chloroflexota bacterium]
MHYRADDGVLICGDARHLGEVPDDSVDLITTDPPFNVGVNYGAGISDRLTEDEYGQFTRQWLAEALRVLKPGGQLFAIMPEHLHVVWRSVVPVPAKVLTWHKTFVSHLHRGPSYLDATEPILWIVKGPRPSVFHRTMHFYSDVDWFIGPNATGESIKVPEMRLHPTPRPSWLFEEFVMRATNPGDVVLDPMLGSGPAVVAARRLGRRFIGYDLNPDYVVLAAARVERTMFDPTRLDRASNGALALREFIAWAFAHQHEFWPLKKDGDERALGRLGPEFLAVRPQVLKKQLHIWGYNVTAVLDQWTKEGVITHEKGKRTRVVRVGDHSERLIVVRL